MRLQYKYLETTFSKIKNNIKIFFYWKFVSNQLISFFATILVYKKLLSSIKTYQKMQYLTTEDAWTESQNMLPKKYL